ncbi:Pkinase-domain-containing protein [Panus rudis PR-1116 ss-1]|nr:Pkinase-domain-containing protein [Panus rudis PR-1116 ss-1]
MLHDTECDPRPSFSRSPYSENTHMLKARMFNPRFPSDHILNSFFARNYLLGDELGAGGYGFVMTARHRLLGHEVAVKFIIKEKVPEHAWWDDEILGRVPTEVMVMSLVNHENIVRCLDLFEDERYFYLVQELHGTPWVAKKSKKTNPKQISAPGKLVVPSPVLSTPSLTPSPSVDSNLESESLPGTPPQVCIEDNKLHPHSASSCLPSSSSSHSLSTSSLTPSSLTSTPPSNDRPTFSRRASYDLFECIEQSKNKRLEEGVARYVFAQVVEAVYYLSEMGITHCDIKDENLVVDAEFKVKLIDFGSALISYPPPPSPSSPTSPSSHSHPHPQEEYHTLFFGTTAYAASEILLKQPYRAAPAEIWTLGVLLSYLVTGHSPFETERDAVEGRVRGWDNGNGRGGKISRAAVELMKRCLEKDPCKRADIEEVRGHRWLRGALERGWRG